MSRSNQSFQIGRRMTAVMHRRDLLRLAVAGTASVIGGSLLAACGGGSSPTQASGQTQSTSTAAPASTTAPAATTASGASASPAASGTPKAAATQAVTVDPKKNAKIVLAQGVDIKTFDPHEDTSSAAIAIFQNVFDNLVARDQELKVAPSIAESWQTIDNTTWEFKLRKNVKFHDGTSLTGKDVQFTFQHVLDPKVNSLQRTRLQQIDHVDVVDDFTVHLVTKVPLPPLLDQLRYGFILPADKYQSMGAEKFATSPIGTGPYKYKEWIKDQHVALERFDDHWRGKAAFAAAEFRPIAEDATRVAALKTGEINLATVIPVPDVDGIKSDPKLDIRPVRSLRTIFVGMNCFKDPFTNVKVRQALNYAVDVPSIIKNLFNGHAYQTGSVVGPAVFGYDPNIKPYPYDPDKAKSLLTEAGFPNGFSTVLDTPQGRYLQDVEVAQAIAGQLAKVGVKADVKPAEFNEYFNRWLAKKIEGLYFLGYGGTQDADALMGSHFDSKRRGLYYNSPQSDALISQAQSELDPKKREQLYFQIDEYLHDQAPWIFLYDQEDIYGITKAIQWKAQPDERLWVYDMVWT